MGVLCLWQDALPSLSFAEFRVAFQFCRPLPFRRATTCSVSSTTDDKRIPFCWTCCTAAAFFTKNQHIKSHSKDKCPSNYAPMPRSCAIPRFPQPPSVPAIVFEPAVIICKLALKLKMATTLDEMAALFATKTSNLKRSMELRSAGKAINRNCKLYI